MKLWVLFFVFVLQTRHVLAQDFSYVGVTTGISKSIIYNKSDFQQSSDSFKHNGNYVWNYGLEYGINTNKPLAMVIQAYYCKQSQTYEGTYFINNIKYTATNQVDLDYIKVPIYAEMKNIEYKKIKPCVAFGMYGAYRLKYNDFSTFVDGTTNNPNGFTEQYTNKTYEYKFNNDFFTDSLTTTKKPLYTAFNVGFIGGVGASYQLDKHLFVHAKLMGDYSMSNPEYQSYKSLKPYKWRNNSVKRADSHLINYGLQFSIRYQFKPGE